MDVEGILELLNFCSGIFVIHNFLRHWMDFLDYSGILFVAFFFSSSKRVCWYFCSDYI